MTEKRYTVQADLKIETREDNDSPLISGYAIVYNQVSEDLGGFREQIEPGAFTEAIQGDVRALWQHDRSQVLGRTAANTLRLFEDDHGVRFELDAAPTQAGRDAVALIGRGDVDQMSFGFSVPSGGDTWATTDAGGPLRKVTTANLREISPVTWPAYAGTSAESRDIYGDHPVIPDGLQAQPDGDSSTDADQARARLANRTRRLDIMEMEG